MSYSEDLKDAPRDGSDLIFIVPTGKVEEPYATENGKWDGETARWDGDWRYDMTDSSYADAEPIAWKAVEAPSDAIVARCKEIARKKLADAQARLAASLAPKPAKPVKVPKAAKGKPNFKVSTKDQDTFEEA